MVRSLYFWTSYPILFAFHSLHVSITFRFCRFQIHHSVVSEWRHLDHSLLRNRSQRRRKSSHITSLSIGSNHRGTHIPIGISCQFQLQSILGKFIGNSSDAFQMVGRRNGTRCVSFASKSICIETTAGIWGTPRNQLSRTCRARTSQRTNIVGTRTKTRQHTNRR